MRTQFRNYLIFCFILFSASLSAQQVNFPSSSSHANAVSVRDDIFRNEASMRFLSSYLQAAEKQGIHDAALQQMNVSRYIEKNEEWLATRGISIHWPKGTLDIEKAKFISNFVAEIRPYDRSAGNENLGMNIQYFRTPETADFLKNVYGKDFAPAQSISVTTTENYELTVPTGVSLKGSFRFVGMTDGINGKILESYGITDPIVHQSAEKSSSKNFPHVVLDSGVNKVFLPVARDAQHDAFTTKLASGEQPSFGLYNKGERTIFSAHFSEEQTINLAEHDIVVIKRAANVGEPDAFIATNSLDQSHAAQLANRSELYIGSAEAATQAYIMIDKDYARYVAKNEKSQQEREARNLAREQERAAKILLKEQESLEQEQKKAAEELLEQIENQESTCDESASEAEEIAQDSE